MIKISAAAGFQIIIKQAYLQGFSDRCVEMGLRPSQLVATMEKEAQDWFHQNIVVPVDMLEKRAIGWDLGLGDVAKSVGSGIADTASQAGQGLYNAGKGVVDAGVTAGKNIADAGVDIGAGAVNMDPARMAKGTGNMVAAPFQFAGDTTQKTLEGTTQAMGGLTSNIPVANQMMTAGGNAINSLGNAATGGIKNVGGISSALGQGNMGDAASSATAIGTGALKNVGNAVGQGSQIPAIAGRGVQDVAGQTADATQNTVNKATGGTPNTPPPAAAARAVLPAGDIARNAQTQKPSPGAKPMKDMTAPAPAPQAQKVQAPAAAPAITSAERNRRVQNAAPTEQEGLLSWGNMYNPAPKGTTMGAEGPGMVGQNGGDVASAAAPNAQEQRAAKMDLLKRRALKKMTAEQGQRGQSAGFARGRANDAQYNAMAGVLSSPHGRPQPQR